MTRAVRGVQDLIPDTTTINYMAKEGWGTKLSVQDLIPDMTFEGIFTSYIWLWKVGVRVS